MKKSIKKLTMLSFISFTIFNIWGCKDEDITPNNSGDSDTAFVSTVTFPSLDSVTITADHYHTNNANPVIVLCHQAGWSRGEYIDIAPKLNDMGYNVLAIDQRSGQTINGVENKTIGSAVTMGKTTRFIDAKPDIDAAVDWAKNKYNRNVILWGSSYSACLALMIAAERNDIEKVLAFSPGEYLPGISVQGSISGIKAPVFITSSKQERIQVEKLFDAISNSEHKKQFVPKWGDGQHGSRNLWSSMPYQEEYWAAVKVFLND
jgi:dienelactone hydrolase